MDAAGKVVVVTGGGRGIGRALARRLAREGLAGLVVGDLDIESARATADLCGGDAALTDVAVEQDVVDLVALCMKRFGRVDLFCSNAGTGGDGGIEALDTVWDRCWRVNVMAHVYAARAVIPVMLANGSGYLLNTVSAAGLLTAPLATPYGVSKHAALAFAESLAISYGSRGVTVSALCPGAVDTALLMEEVDPRTREAMLAVTEVQSAEQVAETAVSGIADERFLILTHPETAKQYQQRALDTDRWIRAAQRVMAP